MTQETLLMTVCNLFISCNGNNLQLNVQRHIHHSVVATWVAWGDRSIMYKSLLLCSITLTLTCFIQYGNTTTGYIAGAVHRDFKGSVVMLSTNHSHLVVPKNFKGIFKNKTFL
jgi:hypothetical protein